MPKIDLCFPILGGQIPADHGYLLYSAVSRMLPEAHQPVRQAFQPDLNVRQAFQPDSHQAEGYGIHPIRGRQLGGRTLQLTEHSRLVIRTVAEQIARFLPLAGKQLRFLDRLICIGVPEVRSLVPAVPLRSRMVTIKLPEMAAQREEAAQETFRAAAQRKLAELGIASSALLPAEGQAEGQGEGSTAPAMARITLGKRRTLRIKDREVVGYEVVVDCLGAAESIALQEAGLGGRRHMGCGVFTAHGSDSGAS